MKLVKPSVEVWHQKDVMRQIEKIGRVCYKSEDKITNNSCYKFVNGLINRQHYAMLEHGTIYLKLSPQASIYEEELYNFFIKNPYSVCKKMYEVDANGEKRIIPAFAVTTNYRVIVENKLDVVFVTCEPTEYHERRITAHFVCNRQVSHEFVRHSVFSFAQQSTRYCNYTKGKFGNELTFIEPCWSEYRDDLNNWDDVPEDFTLFYNHLLNVEDSYKRLIRLGWKPQQAANILPNALKTELVMTGFVKDWRHFFDLRYHEVTGPAHPQAKELASQLYNIFEDEHLFV